MAKATRKSARNRRAVSERVPAAEPPKEKPPSVLRRVLLVLFLIVVGGAAIVGAQIEDWNRDFIKNFASTRDEAQHPLERPIRTTRGADELVGIVKHVAGAMPRWRVESEDVDDGGAKRVKLVRQSMLFKFEDDVTVRIEDEGEVRAVHAESRSRIGDGDLGQNPRNVRKIMAAMAEAIVGGRAAPAPTPGPGDDGGSSETPTPPAGPDESGETGDASDDVDAPTDDAGAVDGIEDVVPDDGDGGADPDDESG